MKELFGDLMYNPIIPIWIMAIICVGLLFFKHKGVWGFIRQIIIVLLLFAINLRIMVPDGTQIIQKQSINAYFLFAIDNTLSMLAEDYDGGDMTRYEAVKRDCNYIIETFEGAHFGVVTFDDEAKIAMPFTTDVISAKNMINAVYPKDKDIAKGTSLNVSIDGVKEMLERADNLINKGNKDEKGKVILIYISDGEITKEKEKLDSFKELRDYVDGGMVLGYGTKKGGKMRYYSTLLEEYQLVESHMEPAISHYDEDNMKDIADDIGIEYMHMTEKNQVDDIIDQIQTGTLTLSDADDETVGYADIYYYFVIPVIFLLAIEYISYKRKKI